MSPLIRPLAIALLLGTALLGAGAAVHPVLTGDAATQLRLIGATAHWRAVHLVMLAGSGLVITGIWVRLLLEVPDMRAAVLAALTIISLGLAINALNVAFMAGSGWHMASLFLRGDTSVAALFEAMHPIGLMAARFGNFIVALGALALGWAEWRGAANSPLLAWLAWAAAAGGLLGVVFFDEASRFALAAVALLSGWQMVTGVLALRGGGGIGGGRTDSARA
jgi:hypothetical protein